MRKIMFAPPDIGEEEIAAVSEVLRSGWITTGPKTKEFEKRIAEHCHTEKAVCLNSATAAMEMTLRVLGIGEGDEVITSAYTYTASASVIAHVGAKIVLVDTEPDNFHLNIQQVKEKITEKTKAVIPVDIAGVLCDYDALKAVLDEKKGIFSPSNMLQKSIGRVAIIADSAHAFGAVRDGKVSGMHADFTCFSFHAVKNLTTAEGGAVVWNLPEENQEDLYRQYMLLSLHGQNKDALSKSTAGSWEYDIIAPYYKCNMTDIMAAIGLVQLDRYPDLLEQRQKRIAMYEERLKGLPVTWLSHTDGNHRSSGHLFLVRVSGIDEKVRNEIIAFMGQKGVPCNVHYKPLPLLSAYKNLGFDIGDFPNAYAMYENEITFPLHTLLQEDDIEYIVQIFREALETADA